MHFIMGDLFGVGIIGLGYSSMGGYLLSHIIFFAIVIFAAIGLFTTIKWLFTHKRKKETPGQKWLRTGRMD